MNLRAILPRLTLVLAASIAWAYLNRGQLNAGNLQLQIHSLGAWAPLAFIALFALATVLFLPGAIFGLAGGALFGPLWGSAWNLAGATLGATLAFLTARYVASDWVARRSGGRLKGLIEGVEAEGWRFVAFGLLVPHRQALGESGGIAVPGALRRCRHRPRRHGTVESPELRHCAPTKQLT
jgi:uncharacterized membrane protein YdjX (TVP38/TMEM64 family)